MKAAQGWPELPCHRRLPALFGALRAGRAPVAGAADRGAGDGVRRPAGRCRAPAQDRPQGPVLDRSRPCSTAAPQRRRAVVTELVHRPGHRVRARDRTGHRAGPRPAPDPGAGPPGLPEHPRDPGQEEETEARGVMPAADQHARLPDVFAAQAPDGGDRWRPGQAGPVKAAASNRKNTPTAGTDAAGALVRGADYYQTGR